MGTPLMLSCLVQEDSATIMVFGFGEKKKDEQVATFCTKLSIAYTGRVSWTQACHWAPLLRIQRAGSYA